MMPPIKNLGRDNSILVNGAALLVDFDGPICSVFSALPACAVSEQLRHTLVDSGVKLPAFELNSDDPFDILFHAASLGGDHGRYVEAAFTAHEVEAVQSAIPTPGAYELMRQWHETRRPLAIVSNNSLIAIRTYLAQHNLTNLVQFISARTPSNIHALKPKPDLVEQAVTALHCVASECTMIGDSLADIEASNLAGVKCIAYANRPEKIPRFIERRPAHIATDLTQILFAPLCRE